MRLFLSIYHAFGKKTRGVIYQLKDMYSLFYRKFVNGRHIRDEQ